MKVEGKYCRGWPKRSSEIQMDMKQCDVTRNITQIERNEETGPKKVNSQTDRITLWKKTLQHLQFYLCQHPHFPSELKHLMQGCLRLPRSWSWCWMWVAHSIIAVSGLFIWLFPLLGVNVDYWTKQTQRWEKTTHNCVTIRLCLIF